MRTLLTAALAATLLVGCTGAAPTTEAPPSGVSVDEIPTLAGDGEVLVTGYLFVSANGVVTLASAIAESFPPQPGGATVELPDFDLSGYRFTEEQGIRWTDVPVQVQVTLQNGAVVEAAPVSG